MGRAAPLQNPDVDFKTGKEAMGIAVNEKAVRREASKGKDVGTSPGTEHDAGAGTASEWRSSRPERGHNPYSLALQDGEQELSARES